MQSVSILVGDYTFLPQIQGVPIFRGHELGGLYKYKKSEIFFFLNLQWVFIFLEE